MKEVVVGTVQELWRYPVSSVAGEQQSALDLVEPGVPGERGWALVDAETGKAASPEMEERWRPALFLKSRLTEAGTELGFPDGRWLPVDGGDTGGALSAHFGFSVAVRPYVSNDDAAGQLTAVNRYSPSPIHLVTTSALAQLASLTGAAEISARRFRPNILVRTESEPAFLEKDWLGSSIRVGDVLLRGTEEAKRCAMTFIAQPDISEEAEILRNIVRHNRRNFGIYCAVPGEGRVKVGDPVTVISE